MRRVWFVCINGWGKVEEVFETVDSLKTYCCPRWNKVIKIEDEFARYIINLWNSYGDGPIPSRVSRKWTFKNLHKDFLNEQGG